jgi:hypothetical protein
MFVSWFFPTGGFIGIIMTFYVVSFSCFPHRILWVFVQAFIISSIFSHWIFQKLYSFYAMFKCSKGSVTIQIYVTTWHKSQEPPPHQEPMLRSALGAPKAEPSRPPLEPPHPHMYKRKWGMRNKNTSSFDLCRTFISHVILTTLNTKMPFEVRDHVAR